MRGTPTAPTHTTAHQQAPTLPSPPPAPQVAQWVGAKPRLLVINRADEVAPADLEAWKQHYAAAVQGQGGQQGQGQGGLHPRVYWTDGRKGEGVKGVKKELMKVGAGGGGGNVWVGLVP